METPSTCRRIRGAPPSCVTAGAACVRRPALPGRAFTLIELLVVVALIGLMAATALPAIRSLTQSNAIASGNR
ncbi:type II secretion system protein, partial [Citrobacter sp. AAK_AS5]